MIKIKNLILKVNFYFLFLFLNINCSGNQTKEKNHFNFVNLESSYQNCLTVESFLSLDSTIKISIIDGNNDGKYYTKKDLRRDTNFPDNIVVTDRLIGQFGGTELEDTIIIQYYDKTYLIKIDIENRSGIMEKLDTCIWPIDVFLYNKLSIEKVYSFKTGKKQNLIDILNEEFRYTIAKNWAPFCEPCVEQLTIINRDSCRSRNFDLIFLVDSIYSDQINKYFTNVKLKEQVYLCDYSKINERLKFNGYPSSIIFSNRGDYLKYCSYESIDKILNKYPK